MKINAVNMVQPMVSGKNNQIDKPKTVTSDIKPSLNPYSALNYMAALGKQSVLPFNKPLSVSFTGWAPEAHNKDVINQMVDVIKSPDVQKIAVSGHTSPDGDSVGSTFAMANLINQATGKKVDLFMFGPLPKRYEYLNTNPDVKLIEISPNKSWKDGDKIAKTYGQYDLAVSLDCAENKLMAGDYSNGIFKRAKHSMKIDHHPYKEEFNAEWNKTVNNKFGKMNLIDNSLPAAAEITMQFVEPLGLKPEELRREVKEAMYTGMITDTGCFKFANTPLTFEDAALLMRQGVDNREMNLKALCNTPKEVLEVEKLCLDKIQYADGGKIAYVVEDDEIAAAKLACKNAGLAQEGKDAVKGVAGRLPEIDGVEIGFKVYQMPGRASFSIRSRNVDISGIARQFEGGGHKNAAAFMVSNNGKSTEEVVQQVVEACNEVLNSNAEVSQA